MRGEIGVTNSRSESGGQLHTNDTGNTGCKYLASFERKIPHGLASFKVQGFAHPESDHRFLREGVNQFSIRDRLQVGAFGNDLV